MADGDFSGLFRAYLDHVRRWEIEPDGLALAMMRQGLGAAALHPAFRPHDESVGFTLNVHHPAVNVFITGDGEASTVTGRAFTEGVRTAGATRFFVQSQRPGQKQVQSLVEVEGLDVLLVFEQYYARSEQNPARFFEMAEDRYQVVMSLPDCDVDWLGGLDRDAVAALEGEVLEERIFRFQCGCNPEKMIAALHTIFGRAPEDLFKGEGGVEAFCPRCGARWWIGRDDFDAGRPGGSA